MALCHVFKHHLNACTDLGDLDVEDFRTLQEKCSVVILLPGDEMTIDVLITCFKLHFIRIEANDCVYAIPVLNDFEHD